MDNQLLDTLKFDGGYFDTDELSYPANVMEPSSKNVFTIGSRGQRIFRGLDLVPSVDGGRQMFNVANGYASLNDYSMVEANGSIFNFINESLFWIGAGEVFYNGSVLVDPTPAPTNFLATSNLQLSPKIAGPTYDEAYVAGFAAPDAPTVQSRTPGVSDPKGLMTGVFSFKIARVRSVTGGRSIASLTSAVITTDNQAVRMTFPALDSNGQDRWAIFGTKAGFGGTGVHYLIAEIADTALSTIDSIPRSYLINYVASDLLPVTAYIDDYPPQAALFATRLENYVLTFGSADNIVQASVRNFPESFNPEHIGFLPKQPTALLVDPQGSYVYVSTSSSVHAVSVIPGTENPLIIQTVWSDVGVANNHNWCSVEGVLFAFTAKMGAVTMTPDGKPTSEFASPVAKVFATWDVADVVVLHCPHLNSVLFCNGSTVYAFNLQMFRWSSPADMTDWDGSIVSGVVHDRELLVTMLNGSSFDLYNFDNAGVSNSTEYIIASPWMRGDTRVNLLGLKAAFMAANDATFTLDMDVDFTTVGSKTLTQVVSGIVREQMFTTVQSRWFLPRKEVFRIVFTGTQTDFTQNAFLSYVQIYGTPEESLRLN